MSRKTVLWLAAAGVGIVAAACARNACPSDLEVGATKGGCKWTLVQAGGAKRNLSCSLNGIRVVVDTSGVGEG
jgi:hypothetical protein